MTSSRSPPRPARTAATASSAARCPVPRSSRSPRPPPTLRTSTSDAQAYADEAHQALIVRDVEDIHKRAREAGKVAALVKNPSSGGIGKLAVYLDWRRKQLKETDDALADLTKAAAEQEVADIEGYVKSVIGTDLDSATAAQMRMAAKTLRERKPAAA